MFKSKPVVRELVKRTLPARRNVITDGTRPGDLMEEFPHLRKANYASFGNVVTQLILCRFYTSLI